MVCQQQPCLLLPAGVCAPQPLGRQGSVKAGTHRQARPPLHHHCRPCHAMPSSRGWGGLALPAAPPLLVRACPACCSPPAGECLPCLLLPPLSTQPAAPTHVAAALIALPCCLLPARCTHPHCCCPRRSAMSPSPPLRGQQSATSASSVARAAAAAARGRCCRPTPAPACTQVCVCESLQCERGPCTCVHAGVCVCVFELAT